jgi:hypothetical protein
MKQKKSGLQAVVLVGLLVLLGGAFAQRQAIADWFRLRGYEPPELVSQLASDTSMTDEGRHLFYVNRPVIASGQVFTDECPKGGEKTVVLGCYIGNDGGIYLYDITDERLDGVEQVTAAHEMLHAAYRRLSDDERKRIDALLTEYYENQLSDQRILDTIESYKKSEPGELANEMHSIFATEVADLPAELETYYRQYFTDRSKVIAYTQRYQAEFTSRRTQVAAYDAQLKSLKQQIDSNQTELERQKTALDQQSARLQAQKASGDIAGYNGGVAAYNAAVARYNALLAATKGFIGQYNEVVVARNEVVLEEQQLAKALSSESLPE